MSVVLSLRDFQTRVLSKPKWGAQAVVRGDTAPSGPPRSDGTVKNSKEGSQLISDKNFSIVAELNHKSKIRSLKVQQNKLKRKLTQNHGKTLLQTRRKVN